MNTGLFKLLERMIELPLSATVRSRIWSAMASRLDPVSIRKDIIEIAAVLSRIDVEDAYCWVEGAMAACRATSKNYGDMLLKKKMEEIASESDRISAFVEWANSIQVESKDDEIVTINSSRQKTKDGSSIPAVLETDESQVIAGKDKDISNVNVQPLKPLVLDADDNTEPHKNQVSEKQRVEKWIVRQRMPKMPEFLETLSSDIEKASNSMKGLLENKKYSIDILQQTTDQITRLQNHLQDRLNQLPDAAILREECVQAIEIFKQAYPIVGDDIYELIEMGIPPEDVKDIGMILSKKELLETLPNWVWIPEEEANTNKIHGQAIALSNPSIRQRITNLLDRLSGIDTSILVTLKNTPPPSDNDIFDLYMQQSLVTSIERLRKFGEVDEKDREWISVALKEGFSEDKILDYLSRLSNLHSELSSSEFDDTVEWLRTKSIPVEREEALYLLEMALAFWSESFGSIEMLTFSALKTWIEHNRNAVLSERKRQEVSQIEFEVEHNWMDQRQKLILRYVPYNNVVGNYGFFTAPVLLKCRHLPENLDLLLSYEITSSLTKGWPNEYKQASPTNLRIASDQWRLYKDHYTFAFKIEIPVRKPKTWREPVSISIKALRLDRKEDVKMNGRITWEHWIQSLNSGDNICLDWPDGIMTTYVTSHPIGPQEHLEYIKTRISGGSSFAIVSPRRFGKTTLAMYLKEIGEDWGIVVPNPVLCTEMVEQENGLNFHHIWETFSEDLSELIGASLRPVRENIPNYDTFDHVRKAARQQGKKAILLILDEAQLFFPRVEGPSWGNKIKDRLEREWSRKDLKDKVPLYFGFIGLPDIIEKMGSNLSGLLMPKNTNEISQNRLNQLIYTFTKKTLHTTRQAREELCRRSGNLYMLKTLLSELVAHVNNEKRNWVFYDDVVEIIDELKASLAQGGRTEITQYLRDALNESENVNYWKPRPCYPLAVAMAKIFSEMQISADNSLPHATKLLTKWCMESGYDGSNRLVYKEERVLEHLNALKKLDIVHPIKGFKSDIFEAWLHGQSLNFPNSAADRDALFSGALRRIRLPEVCELVQKGGQAEIYTFSENQELYALRVILLTTQERQRRFYDRIKVLEKIMDHAFQSTDGVQYIYRLKDIGIADAPRSEGSADIAGVEIYKWIDGISLEEKIGRLSTAIVASLGLKIAKGIRLLHEHNILHRDICPRNIILSNSNSDPVLIDFGLASFGIQEMKTVIDSMYTAPEIRGKNPTWSKASDIYSLGATLKYLLKETERNTGVLSEIIEKCQDELSNNRPIADDVIEKLEILISSLGLKEKLAETEKNLFAVTGNDMKNPWFADVIQNKILKIYQSVFMGLHEDTFSLCAEAAQVLDFILEAYPTKEPLKLTYAHNKDSKVLNDLLKNQRCIDFLGILRNYRNHFGKRSNDSKEEKDRILKKYSLPSEGQMKAWAMEGAERIGMALKVDSLPSILESMFSIGEGNL
ncbi:MAG: protein kinase [Syntrophorhabdus sp.]